MIWITGHSGMLGRELAVLCAARGLPCAGTGHEVDIADEAALRAFTRERSVDWIVNCAAYTAVDKAEDEPERCYRVNALGAERLAREAARLGAGFISISTDYVFDGKSARPYLETDPPCPASVYGASKYEGERLIAAAHPAPYILRTSWLYGKYGGNFVHTMLRLMREREELRVVNDQRGSPTQAADLAALILSVISRRPAAGIYHVAGGGVCSWYEFARAIYEEARAKLPRECRVLPCGSADYPAKAARPAYSALDKAKIRAALGYEAADWRERLHQYILETCYENTKVE